MPRHIGKIEDKYFEYSEVTDAPATILMSLEEFLEFYLEEYGRASIWSLQERLDRADLKRTSSMLDASFEDMISGNRYGEGGACLSPEDFVARLQKETQELLDHCT